MLYLDMIRVTGPSLAVVNTVGHITMDTGDIVVIVFSIHSLFSLGFDLPANLADRAIVPWAHLNMRKFV